MTCSLEWPPRTYPVLLTPRSKAATLPQDGTKAAKMKHETVGNHYEGNSIVNAATYVRVSTGRQEKEETIDSQLDEIRAAVAAYGATLSEDNIFADDGWTGEILQRPALDEMRDAAAEGRFQVLFVYDRGRLSRQYAYQ